MSAEGQSLKRLEEEDVREEDERERLFEELKLIRKDARQVRKRNELLKRCLREFFKKRKVKVQL